MSYQDVYPTQAQQEEMDAASIQEAFGPRYMFGPNGRGVPRVLPPAPPPPERTWEELVTDAEQIRKVHLWYLYGDGTHCPYCGGELEWRWGIGRYCQACDIAF